MEHTREVSRKEFLELVPKLVVQNVRALFQERLNCSDDSETETLEEDSADIKAKVVRLDEECCLAWGGMNCQSCYLACPLRDKAIALDDQRPIVNMSFCDGCGQCVTACRTVNDWPALKIVYKRGNPEMPARPQSSQDKFLPTAGRRTG